MLTAALALAVTGARAQSVNIPVPVDVSKVTTQVNVSTTFKDANGVWWQASGTLTVKPVAAPASGGTTTGATPPPPSGVENGLPDLDVPTPVITAMTVTDNDRLLVSGDNFGPKGQLRLDATPWPVLAWNDNLVLASLMGFRPKVVTVVREDGLYYIGGVIR